MEDSKIMRVLVLLLVAVFLFGGAQKSIAQKVPIVLKYASLDKSDSIIGRGQDWYLKRVEERTKGNVKFDRYWSDTLVPARQIIEALNSGIIDVGFLIPPHYPARLPLINIGTLPTTNENAYASFMAMHDLIEQVPAVKEELTRAKIKYLTSSSFPAYVPLTRKPMRSLDDFKGRKIRALGSQLILIKALGAAAVSIPTPEVYTALERGTIDGTIYPPLLIVDFGLFGAAKYLWKLPIASSVSMIVMGLNSWNKLPTDIHKIMEEVNLEHAAAYYRIVQIEGNDKEAISKLKAEGVIITEASEEEKSRLRLYSKPIWQEWIKEMESKGLPGQKVADTYQSLLEKYATSVPK
jgi:TRAP-type C4-dicarboxylate transport system substrate-binding protein